MSKRINPIGLQEIYEFLRDNHILPPDSIDADIVAAWARDAEFQLAEGNDPVIEIRAARAVAGAAVCYTISPEGVT